MFDDIGKKIKGFTTACSVIGMIGSLIGAIFMWASGDGAANFFAGLAVLIGGIIVFWAGAFMAYGFGVLIDKTSEIADGVKRIQLLNIRQKSDRGDERFNEIIKEVGDDIINEYEESLYEPDDTDTQNNAKEDECPYCFSKISKDDVECPNCGNILKKK